jgi:diguanylate cyclase (GGDEF)-like protein/PAS domain S-box-containing protein
MVRCPPEQRRLEGALPPALAPRRVEGEAQLRPAEVTSRRARRFLYLLILLGGLVTAGVIANGLLGDQNHVETVLSVVLLVVLAFVLRVVKRRVGAAFAAEEQLRATLAAAPVAIAVLDPAGTVRSFNGAAETTFGWSAAEVVGRMACPNPAEDPARVAAIQARALHGEALAGVALRLLDRQGTAHEIETYTAPIRDEAGRTDAIVACWLDVTERNRARRELERLATHDALTGLPNRRIFDGSLRRAVAYPALGKPTVLMLIDCDNLKLVNDTAGYDAGDRVLASVARALREAIRPADLLARLGGDEFAAVLSDVSLEEAAEVAHRLLARVGALRLQDAGHPIDPTVSIGVCAIERDETEGDALWKADAALFAAKDLGRNRVLLAEDERVVELALGGRWSGPLKEALSGEGFVLVFQPIIRLRDRAPAFYEALLRLKDADGNLIPPASFLPTAEQMSVMPRIDTWVVDEALRCLARRPDLHLLVNLSPASLTDEAFPAWLESRLRGSNAAGRIGVEITEAAAFSNAARAEKQLRTLKGAGCLVALDDFGSGFSSFSRIQTLPVDLLKVDRTLTCDLDTNPTSRAIMAGIRTLAQAIGAKIVAEAVENEEITSILNTLKIEYAQGYHFGHPADLDSLSAPVGAAA